MRPRCSLKALDDVSFDIEEGEFFGLLGPNGAGKTTLISILAGLSRATRGRVLVMGMTCRPTTRRPAASWAWCRRSWCSTRSSMCARPCASSPAISASKTTTPGSTNCWTSLGLADKADANMRQLSGGMKRRVLVAQALVHKPPVIVLDEPTAGVDVELRQTLWQFIAKLNKQGHTVLLTTHYLEEAEALCSRMAMLKQGRVVALARTSELLKAASSNVLRFKIDSELPPALAAQARITGRIVQLPAHNAGEVERYLAGCARRACTPKTWRSARPTWRCVPGCDGRS
jgi:ABC-2 type transport system ATP-binding protein